MKPRYYPHITVTAAVVITILPLCLVLSLPHLRDTTDAGSVMAGSPDSWDAEIDSTITPTATPDDKSAVAIKAPNSVKPRPTAAPAIPDRPASQETRLAMRTNSPAESASRPRPGGSSEPVLTELWPAIAAPPQSRPLRDAGVMQPDVSSGSASGETVTENVPVPAYIAATAAILPAQRPAPPTDEDNAAMAEKARLDAELETALADRKTDRGPTYFDSTGHLAMMTAPAKTPTRTPAVDPVAEQTSNPRRRRDHSGRMRASADVAGSVATAARRPADAANHGESLTGDQTEFGTMPVDTVEDVILQQPLETRQVNRVEPVVAVTRARGWPIAMVRSDLPDDHWWVQQMVGIRGNAFAARVNFGNDDSIPGSVYHLMIVFLDSPDEVRRFRIAKQFKEVPEGVRHSRQFTFVRQ